MKNKFNSLKWTYNHLRPAYRHLVNLSLILFVCLLGALFVHPAAIGGGMLYLVFGIVGTGIGNFYDQSAYQPDGSEIWYFQFANKKTDAVISFGGGLGSIIVTDPGAGYTVAPAVTISAPGGGGTTATGTAILSGGMVVRVDLVLVGTGYTTVEAITVSFAAGTSTRGATATAYVADGWHLGPGRLKHNLKAGQKETNIIGESNKPWTTKKNTADGELSIELAQNDILTMRAFAKYMSAYDCRVFIYAGPSRGDYFKGYVFIGKVRWSNSIDWGKGGDTLTNNTITAAVLSNKSAMSITNSTDLPVSGLGGVYSLAAEEQYSLAEEVIAPTV